MSFGGSTQESYMAQCLYDLRWQLLRVRMLGKWTTNSCIGNIARCRMYITEAQQVRDTTEVHIRTWRVLNLINAVLLGIGGKEAISKRIIKEYQQELMESYSNFPTLEKPEWDWTKVKDDLVMHENTQDLLFIKANLKHRARTAMYRRKTLAYRPELVRFLDILESELQHRRLVEDR